MQALRLGATAGNWQRYQARQSNSMFKQVSEQVYQRDQNVCQYCGFYSDKMRLNVINHDGDYQNNVLSNLVVACEVCSRCTLLDYYARDYEGEDALIYCPEVSQAQINMILHSIVCCHFPLGGQTEEMKFNAKNIYSSLKERAAFLEELSQAKISHPSSYLLIKTAGDVQHELTAGLRFLRSLSDLREYFRPHYEPYIQQAQEAG